MNTKIDNSKKATLGTLLWNVLIGKRFKKTDVPSLFIDIQEAYDKVHIPLPWNSVSDTSLINALLYTIMNLKCQCNSKIGQQVIYWNFLN